MLFCGMGALNLMIKHDTVTTKEVVYSVRSFSDEKLLRRDRFGHLSTTTHVSLSFSLLIRRERNFIRPLPILQQSRVLFRGTGTLI